MEGSRGGGHEIEIKGAGFGNQIEDTEVFLDGIECEVLHTENSLIKFVTPPNSQELKSEYIGGQGLHWKRYSDNTDMSIDQFLLDDLYLNDEYSETQIILNGFTQYTTYFRLKNII
jgi:hypothetical protein